MANLPLGAIHWAVSEQAAEATLLARKLANRQESASPWVAPCSGLSFPDLPPSSSGFTSSHITIFLLSLEWFSIFCFKLVFTNHSSIFLWAFYFYFSTLHDPMAHVTCLWKADSDCCSSALCKTGARAHVGLLCMGTLILSTYKFIVRHHPEAESKSHHGKAGIMHAG